MLQVVGQPLVKPDAPDKATGTALYAGDLKLPGLLHGKILHSPVPHARIVQIDVTAARRLPGVKAVLTGRDILPVRIGRFIRDRTVLAVDRVRYVGEFVAAVAAVDEETALEALELIRVEYEELPAVFSPEAAMATDAPVLHPDLESYVDFGPTRRWGNVRNYAITRHGNVDEMWERAYLVHEDSYRTEAVHHGYLEPRAVVAEPHPSGKLTIWSSSKAVFTARSIVAEALGLPSSRVRIIAPTVGGDFGGKGNGLLEPVCALLARAAGSPVRLALTRAEELSSTITRHPSTTRLKIGVAKNGTFQCIKGTIVLDSGAYSDAIGGVAGRSSYLSGPYRYQAVELEGYSVYTNNTPRGHVRAPGTPQPHFAIESHVEAVAALLGMDPLELRAKNAVIDGDFAPGARASLSNVGLGETIQRVRTRMDGRTRRPNRGHGFACGQWAINAVGTKLPPSSVIVRLNDDGTATVQTGVVDTGGGQLCILRQIAAEELGMTPEDIYLISADTDTVAWEEGTGSSATTYRVGTSMREAARDAREQILRLASLRLEANPDDLEIRDGRVMVRGVPDRAVSLAEVGRESLSSSSGAIVGTGAALRAARAQAAREAKDTVDAPCYGTHAVEVEVDRETGQVRVLKYLAVQDVGLAVNPARVEEQIQGAIAFGLGYALTERVITQQGRVVNANLADYKLSAALEMPSMEVDLVEKPSRFGPFGAKGVGEPPTALVAAAVANAIFDATGVRVRELPITPERMLAALRAAESGGRPPEQSAY